MSARSTRRGVVASLAVALTTLALAFVAVPAPVAGAQAAAACPTAATPHARYVAFLYHEILDRCPDAKGLAFWSGRLDAGMDRETIAETLDTSTENLGRNNVDRLYADLLGRAPTAQERRDWITWIRASHEDAIATATLLASDESYDLRTSATATPATRDAQWLTLAYERILDRAPDPTGVRYYTAWFERGGSTAVSRRRVALSLEHSSSNARSWVRAAAAEALGRPATTAEVPLWMAWLTGPGHWQTFRLWTLQLSSAEAYRRGSMT